jgi:O-antigen biosynthesis protein
VAFAKIVEYLRRLINLRGYDRTLRDEIISRIASQSGRALTYRPCISIVMPVFRISPKILEQTIESILQQTYTNWQLCIHDDNSREPGLASYLSALAGRDGRISVSFGESNEGIVAATNHAVRNARGDYVAFMDDDDLLVPDALFQIVCHLENKRWDLIYTDEDKVTLNNRYLEPFRKPDFSPHFLLSANYISHFCVVRRGVGEEVGWLRHGFEGSQDYDFVLRVTELTDNVLHIPLVLYHWRKIPGSTAEDAMAKPYAYESGVKALTDAMNRRNVPSHVFKAQPGHYLVRPIPPGHLPALVIVACKSLQSYERMKKELGRAITSSETTEIVYLYLGPSPHPQSQDVLFASSIAQGLRLCLMKTSSDNVVYIDDDISALTELKIHSLLSYLLLPSVGVVSGKIVSGSHVVECGLALDQSNGVINPFAGHHTSGAAHMGILNDIRDVSAVSFKFVAFRKRTYLSACHAFEDYRDNVFGPNFCVMAKLQGLNTVVVPWLEVEYAPTCGSLHGLYNQPKLDIISEHIPIVDPFLGRMFRAATVE